MSRHSEPARSMMIDEDGNMVECPTWFHSGMDMALGKFFDITDKRFAGTANDRQGEGYVLEWSQKWGISTNLIGAKDRDINNVERLLELVEEFINKMEPNDT